MVFLSICIINAEEITKYSKSSILIESSTGKILYENNIHEKRSPASMTKMMTLLLTMEALEKNKISLEDQVFISKNASSKGGTQIFAKENTYVSAENLIKGMGIASANDAASAMAEYIGGTEENFVSMMNKRAKELGCKNTNFMNPHGLDEENHYSTAYDLSLIAKKLVTYDYILKITSTYEDYIMVSDVNHWLVNTNKLVKFYNGIDGLKTGYTDNALYCLTATMKKNNMRLISIVMGVDTKDNRSTDTINLLEYGYSMYGSKNIVSKEKYSGNIYIPNSKLRNVKYYLKDDVNIIVDKNTDNVNYKIEEEMLPVKAPLDNNSVIGKLKLTYNDEMYSYDLIVKECVKKSNYFNTFVNQIKDVINGKINILY